MAPKAKHTAKAGAKQGTPVAASAPAAATDPAAVAAPYDESIKNMDLDKKIEAFRTHMLTQKDSHSRGMFLKRYFSQKGMSALWSRLHTLRYQAKPPEIKKAWQDIQTTTDGSNTGKKQGFLANALVFPDQ